jgi:hypothetical protein
MTPSNGESRTGTSTFIRRFGGQETPWDERADENEAPDPESERE